MRGTEIAPEVSVVECWRVAVQFADNTPAQLAGITPRPTLVAAHVFGQEAP